MIHTEERTGSRVETTYKGTLDECLDAIRHEIICNHPVGYGTYASLYYDSMGGVEFVARIKRMASCD